MDNNIFDNHAAYNKFLSVEGMRPSETSIKPSLYICDCKMKKAFKELTDDEIRIIFKNEKAEILGLRKFRERLKEKLDELLEWQTFYALIKLFSEGKFECAKFIINCEWDDICPFEDETELYLLINKKW
jgi:hypothetical protein